MDISIIIVNFNTKQLLHQLIISIKKNIKLISYEILVVDNDSSDQSVKYLIENHKDVRLIKNPSNTGFSKANNQAAKIAKGSYLLLLNSDTIVYEDAIEKMMEYLEVNNDSAIVGPKLLNSDGTVQKSCGIFPTLLTELACRTFLDRVFPNNRTFGAYKMGNWDYSSIRKVDWVTGACMMIRKDVYNLVNGFDENFYMFYEDVDLCFRVRQLGHEIVFLPESRICHIGGASWREFREIPILNSFKSSYIYFVKHRRKWQIIILRTFFLFEILLTYIGLIPYLFLHGEESSRIKSRVVSYGKGLKLIFSKGII